MRKANAKNYLAQKTEQLLTKLKTVEYYLALLSLGSSKTFPYTRGWGEEGLQALSSMKKTLMIQGRSLHSWLKD